MNEGPESAYVPLTRDERIRTTALNMAREMVGERASVATALGLAELLRTFLAGEEVDGPFAMVAQILTLKPGETLIIRLPSDSAPSQVEEIATWLEWQRDGRDTAVRYLLVVGDELAVQQNAPDGS